MKKNWRIVCFTMFVVTMLIATSVSAVELESLTGKGSVSAFGNMSNSSTDESDDSITTGMLGGSLGYFFNNNVELKATLIFMGGSSDDSDFGATTFSGDLNYNFFNPRSTAVPYIGVNAGIYAIESGDYDDSYSSAGFQVGAKFFLTESISFNLEGRYTMIFMEESDANNLMATFGFSYYFGGK